MDDQKRLRPFRVISCGFADGVFGFHELTRNELSADLELTMVEGLMEARIAALIPTKLMTNYLPIRGHWKIAILFVMPNASVLTLIDSRENCH